MGNGQKKENQPLYGRLLIDRKLREQGASLADLATRIGFPKARMPIFYIKMKDPGQLTLYEARAIAAVLGFTAEEIYNSFILWYGWEEKYVENGHCSFSQRQQKPSKGRPKRGKKEEGTK